MNYCPNCGAPVSPPEHIADECYTCHEPLGLWFKDVVDDDLEGLDHWLWMLVGACVTALAVWFVG